MQRKTYDTIKKERSMLNVERMACSPKIKGYNLADHSYYVAMMFQDLADEYEIQYDTTVMKIVMRHDFMEAFTGDLIYPVKNLSEDTSKAWNLIEKESYDYNSGRYNGIYSDADIRAILTPEQFALLKACDAFELFLFCMSEYRLGNHTPELKEILLNCFYIEQDKRINQFEVVKDIVTQMIAECAEIHLVKEK